MAMAQGVVSEPLTIPASMELVYEFDTPIRVDTIHTIDMELTAQSEGGRSEHMFTIGFFSDRDGRRI
jgi:hypothetical protein